MFEKVKEFFLEKALGRIIVRVSASLCAYLASGAIGVQLNLNPAEVTALLSAGVNALISLLKPRVKAEVPAAPVV
jgi:hypothetical protein